MRVQHKAGDKLYIDFAGEKLSIVDRKVNRSKHVEVFVAVIGASQLTYVEAVMTQTKQDFIPACENALEYIGGVPGAIVPDNLRSAVSRSNRYEPTINETFADFAEHYNTTILPARAYRPTDKALVEIAIRIIYTRIYAKLRAKDFFSLAELNEAILKELEDHNNQLMTGRNYTRRQLFEEVERKALSPLPGMRYEFKKQYWASVMKNGHVSLPEDKHYYSVPYRFIGRQVKVMYTREEVLVFHNYERIARHKRDYAPFNYTTDQEHVAVPFRFITDWTPEHFINRAGEIHKDVKLYITQILNRKKHPEQAYKVCEGVLNLTRKVGKERLIKACQRALSFGLYNYRTVQKILEKGLDKDGMDENPDLEMPEHDNIRGGNYYK
jgi:transposase